MLSFPDPIRQDQTGIAGRMANHVRSRQGTGPIRRQRRSLLGPSLERLEDRTLFSLGFANPTHVVYSPSPGVVQASATSGYSPAQIRHAYGFDQIAFGGVQGDGRGQTIAIVDAYDDPRIASDLAVFDQTFGLPAPPSFTKVDQHGGSQYPAGDPGWAEEISLDVEWAHAIASAANILLVEANTSSYSDLLTAVDYARNQPGVVAVSLSWGSDEFSSEAQLDSHFTTPAGHAGITFVASSGDWGAPPIYPAASPNVVAVGGTSLYLNSDNTWKSETGWSDSGDGYSSSGGYSYYEPRPAYQMNINSSTSRRMNPDVAYDADPETGFKVYDTYQESGWRVIGGTSAGAPQWAALIAIADQGRATLGLGSLDGASQSLPLLYQMPSTNFRDITTGSNGYNAGPGYDLVTGLGSPRAAFVTADLIGGRLSINDVSLREGNSGPISFTFTISLSAPSSQSVTVHWATADGTATTTDNDYRATSGTVTFQPGQTTQTISVEVVGDTKNESDETFFVNLSNPSSNAEISKGKGTATLVNDDPGQPIHSVILPDGTHILLDIHSQLWSLPPSTSDWTLLDGGVASFAVAGNGHVIDLNAQGVLYEILPSASGTVAGGAFQRLDGGVASFAVAGNGHVIDLNVQGVLYEILPSASGNVAGGSFQRIDGGVASFAVAGNGHVIVLNVQGVLYEILPSASGSVAGGTYQQIASGVSSFAIASNGNIVSLQANGQLSEFLRTSAGTFDPAVSKLLGIGVADFAVTKDDHVTGHFRDGRAFVFVL
jgi:hypothetical protein